MEYNYNTQRKKLVLPEYGRNIQKMINYLHEIEDKDERNKAANTIISIMQSMAPYGKDPDDQKRKLWDHMALISDFPLDVDSPYELPDGDIRQSKPEKVPYNSNRIKIKHYGRGIELMIEHALAMGEGEKEEKEALVLLIANHMKRAYLTWNKSAVEDEVILADMDKLSGGKLKLRDDQTLADSRNMIKPRKKMPYKQKGDNKYKNQRGRGRTK